MKKQRIRANVADLILNEGQLDWLPENPRSWTRTDIDRTIESLKRDPDFQEDNPLKVVLGEQPRIFLEKTRVMDNSTTFAYLEAGYKGGAMVKLFHEQKFWDAPAYIHAEYQSAFDGSHTAIAGGTWSFGLPNGFISLSPLYRYDFGINTHAIQLSNCYLASWKWCELYGYNHAWYNGGFCFFGEERFHVKITQNLMIGAILDITHFGRWDASISVGVRYDL